MVAVTVPVWLLIASVLAALVPVGFLTYSQMTSQGKKMSTLEQEKLLLEQEKILLLKQEITRLEQELALSRGREVEARVEGNKTGEERAYGSIKVLMTTKHRMLENGLFSKVTERANLFIVMAGGQLKAGYLGEEAMTEDQLRKVLETMKIVSDIVGCSSSSVLTKTLDQVFHHHHDN